jgi:DNA-binding LacI/PurR family transcriptional regulator
LNANGCTKTGGIIIVANIKDVAKAAGVSTSTVSRTINNSPSISLATKERIFSVMRELNYSPNMIAKSLTNNKSYTVTLIVDVEDEKSYQNPFFYEIMHGIERHVYRKEYSLIVANLNSTQKNQSVIEWLIKGKRTDGVILPASILSSAMIEILRKYNIPFVAIGEPVGLKESVSWVDVDNKKGTENAMYYLFDKGYRNIGFLGLNKTQLFSRKRLEGYKSALADEPHEIDNDLIRECMNTKREGYQHMIDLLQRDHRPDAIICADSHIAFGAIKACGELHLRIPEDIGIISYDNSQLAEISDPEITTVYVDVFELGLQSAKQLFELIEDPQKIDQGLLISTSIKVRETA